MLTNYEENLPTGKWIDPRAIKKLRPNTVPIRTDIPPPLGDEILNNNQATLTTKIDVDEMNNSSTESNDTNQPPSENSNMNNTPMDIEEEQIDEPDNEKEQFDFTILLTNLHNLKLPSNGNWNYIISPDKKMISFVSFSAEGVLQRVNVYSDLSLQVLLNLIRVPHMHLPRRLNCLNDVIDFLMTIHY